MNLLIVDDEYLVVEEVVTVTDWGCWVLRRFILLQMQLALFEF